MAKQEPQAAPGSEIGNKLSAKSFGWDKTALLKAVMADENTAHFLYRVVGVATGLRKYNIPKNQQKDGETHGFGLSGQFEAVGSGGKELKGSVLYLPKYVHDMVEAALSLGDDVAGVRIGFDVYAEYNEASATSYVFTARDLLNEGNANVDELKQIVASLPMPSGPVAPQLEAPKS